MTSYKERYYPESKFGGFTNIDGTIHFYTRVNALIQPDFVVLDYGCGRGAYAEDPVAYRKNLRIFQHKCQRVIGVDVDEDARQNPFIDEFHLLENGRLPLPDNSVDLCVCDWVLEHIEFPVQFFGEMQRVLKLGGYLCIRTSNRWSYVSILAQLLNTKYHNNLLSKVQSHRDEMDVFPKYFRCNSKQKLQESLNKISNEFIVFSYEFEPAYLSFSRWVYIVGKFYHKLTPGSFRTTLMAFSRML